MFYHHHLLRQVCRKSGSYRLFLNWQDEFGALQIICQFPTERSLPTETVLARLFMAANAQLWLGHFECGDDRIVQFRYTTLLHAALPSGGIAHMNDLFKLAVAECDRFFPALRLLTDQPEAPDALLTFALQDIVGEG